MFRNRKVILPSVAIVFTLIVCSILVNFALANSGTPAGGNNANSIATTALTGYTNIDLAVMASNDAGKKATGEDKYRILQILPESMSSYAQADQAMTAKVTADGYSGTINKEANYKDTSSLWKYVYDGEFFRYAVFNGYKTISANMAEGAVQLTTATVGELNKMDADAQAKLASADFIYIAAFKSSDYGAGGVDLDSELYSWLDFFATSDRHPMVIDRYALCLDNPEDIHGNNDTYRMGALAYKLMTQDLVSRYDNVLVTEPDFFYDLFVEAQQNAEIPPMTSTTKTISDFILTAERGANDGGRNYIGNNRYYKWYTDVHSFEQFTAHDVGTYYDSAYAQIVTSSQNTWTNNFDNAKVLIISEDAQNSEMFNQFKEINDAAAGGYIYNSRNGIWEAEATARNSEFTSSLYARADSSAYIPSGADIFLLEGTGDNVLNALSASGAGATFADIDLAGTYYRDIKTMTLSGTVTSASALPDLEILLMVRAADGTYHYAVDSSGNMIRTTVTDVTDYSQEEPAVYSYEYSFERLNADAGYTYLPILNDATSSIQPSNVGSNGYDFDIVDAAENQKEDYDYDAVNTHTGVVNEEANAISEGRDSLYAPGVNDRLGPTQDYYVSLQEDTDVAAYVVYLHDVYQTSALNSKITPTMVSLSDYDFIFIDAGTYSEEIGDTAYQALCAAAEANQYIIVSSEAGDGIGSGTGEGGGEKPPIIVNSPSAKALADIINAGVYRDGADNKYRVLEIQPNYPIDEELAEQSSGGSAYTKHSDGTSFTGNYYTVPSDVATGKAKEELPSDKTEYYEFDLTKAKIAYAVDGVQYGDIELTQVSTEALVGMTEDLVASYDLIYIGGDISAMDRSLEEIYAYNPIGNGVGASALSSGIPSFIMYTHTGMLQLVKKNSTIENAPVMATGLLNGTNDVYMPENGNDLTNSKYEQLLAYMNAGRPIMLSKELTSVYEKMHGLNVVNGSVNELTDIQLLSGYWFKDDGQIERGNMFLDPSSRIYKFVDAAYKKSVQSDAANIIWGFDPSDTQMIANPEGEYGDTLYTYNKTTRTSVLDNDVPTSWNADDMIKKYAVVFSDESSIAINNLIQGSEQRVRLTVLSKPAKYIQGIEATYLRSTNLSFTFTVEGSSKSAYTYTLYVDIDKNTIFDDNDVSVGGTIKSGEEKTVNMALDPDFFGAASWYLEIKLGDVVVGTQRGVSKIINNTDDKSRIDVLQIQTMSKDQEADYHTMPDMLYFDIESQWAHKIMYYNGQQNNPVFNANMDLIQTSVLGRHENRFGIVEYDYDLSDDDWFSNLADAITDDYDVNLDMVVATKNHEKFQTSDGVQGTYECMDRWAEEADTLEAGGAVDGHTKAQYEALANEALTEYNNAAADVEAPRKALNDFLQGALSYMRNPGSVANGATIYGSIGNGSNTLLGKVRNDAGARSRLEQLFETSIETGEYYLIFLKYFSNANINNDNDFTNQYGEFGRLFLEYRNAKNAELDARDKYKTYLRRSYGADFLKKQYSILLLGPSDDFGNFEIDLSESACNYIKDYVSSGGDLFFFHDTMTPYYKKGAYNLTTTLLDVVGMNRFHIDMTKQANSYEYIQGAQIGTTQPTAAGLVLGTLEEEDYVYTLSPGNGTMSELSSDAYVRGVLLEDGYIYSPEVYGTTNDWQGPINGWESVGDASYVTDWGSVQSGKFYKKQASAGTEGYVFKHAMKYIQMDVPNSWGGTEKKYFEKSATKMPAGTYGYIWKEADPGGEPIYSTGYEYESPDSELYYLTPYVTYPEAKQTAGLYDSLMHNVASTNMAGSAGQIPSGGSWTISAMSMSSMYYAMDKSMGDGKYLNYIYAAMDVNDAVRKTVRDGNHDESDLSQTAKAAQLNEGLVTWYPFNIGSSLNISGTHQQAYSLDLEKPNTTVWYTLAGCNNASSAKTKSSMYAADPYDAMESYFIYTTAYGTGAVTYCGAGHTSVTGDQTKNNDERKLFINVIVNSAAAVVPKPSIKVFEPDTEFKTEMEKDEEIVASSGKTVYKDKVDSKTDTPDFDFRVNIPDDVNISMVNIYYDLDYDEDFVNTRPSYNKATDHMIKSYTTQDELKDIGKTFQSMVRDANTNNQLQLRDEYFTPYGGNYTYIVLEVYYTGSTKPVYVMIKITVSDPLFELTQADTNISNSVDAIAEEKFVLV